MGDKNPRKLYPEKILAEMFWVDRITVRQVVKELKGMGTFIALRVRLRLNSLL